MRDIRADLGERLGAIKAEIDGHDAEVARLTAKADLLQTLIDDEECRWAEQKQALTRGLSEPAHTPLARFILDALGDGQERRMDDLVRVAREMDFAFGGKSPGRSLHFGLFALKKHGAVELVSPGVWRIALKKGV